MRPTFPPLLCLLLVSITAVAAVAAAESAPPTAPPAAPPALSFETDSVVVSGVEPGARVALLGVGHLAGGYLPTQVRFADLLVADARGEARYSSELGVPTWSVWAAVDLGTGEAALAAPDGGELRLREVPPRALRQQLDGLDESRRSLEILLVHPASAPGAGDGAAWLRAFGDGGDDDDDGATDGNLGILASLLEPLGDAPSAPEHFAPGDLLVAVDPATLEVWAASVPGR